MVLSLSLMLSCQREEADIVENVAESGVIELSFDVNVPEMSGIVTKAVDPDGGGIQNLVLYCFDSYDLFITTITLKGEDHKPDDYEPSLSGSFKATVPDHTKTIHIVGNQNLNGFQEDDYRSKSEYEVMSALEASAGRMIYWARKTVEELQDHKVSGNPVFLLRNQAKITVEVKDDIPFRVDGFVVTNTSAFGTIAPYNQESGLFEAPSVENPFVTIPENESKLSDFLDVRGNLDEYVFETRNTVDDPVNVIVKGSYNGGEALYYRIVLMDEEGDQLMLLRNYHYTVRIEDELSYGQASFAEALTAPATNNVWLGIEDSVSEIYGLDYILSVDQTSVVIDSSEFRSPNLRALYYTLKKVDGTPLTQEDKPEVSWLDGNNVAYNGFIHEFNPATGRGIITVTLHDLGGLAKREGTLLVKAKRLYRKIKVTTIRKQTFTPAWASTQVYGHNTGEHLTLMFTIPEDCPQEFFPLEVLVSTNILDIRHESGQELPIRFVSDGGYYGEPNEWGYKYVYTATAPGKQRLYLENILVQPEGGASLIRIEAQHFDMLEKNFTFSTEIKNKAIILHDLETFSATMPADDPIFYYLVPQKVNAHVEFSTHLGELYDTESSETDGTIISGGETKYVNYIPAGQNDEFLIYSRYLTHEEASHECDFDFFPINEDKWGSGGRVFGYVKNDTGYSGSGTGDNYGAHFHMLTNSSRSEEVVRLASNPKGQPSVTGSGLCTGDQYRSVIFELGNYHPFAFAAQVSYEGVTSGLFAVDGSSEDTDVLTWTYEPEKSVDISFDLTSFRAFDGKSVDPFGTAFEVYIDAPMLKLDKARIDASWLEADANGVVKIREDESVPGRVIYTVAADRNQERAFGEDGVLIADSGADQSGERKTIPFTVKNIVSAGEISISSQEDIAVFNRKTFRVQNESIRGRLRYRNGTLNDVPYEAFVVLERIRTYNRIGTVTIGSLTDGKNMEVRLRGEYSYGWNNDPVKLQYARTSGGGTIVYEKTFDSLNQFYSTVLSEDIILEPKQ